MKNILNNMKYIYMFISLLFFFIFLSGFHFNKQKLPSLEEISPITKNINAVKEIFVPARGSWNRIDLRLTNTPVMFTINAGNIIGSNTDTYNKIRHSLTLNSEITLWALPKGPTLSEAFFFTNINRKPLHELNLGVSENAESGLNTFQERTTVKYNNDILTYDVVQILLNGKILLNYDIYSNAKKRNDKQLYWLWIILGIATSTFGLLIAISLLSKTQE